MTKVYNNNMDYLGIAQDITKLGKIKSRGLEIKDGQAQGYVVLASTGFFASTLGLIQAEGR